MTTNLEWINFLKVRIKYYTRVPMLNNRHGVNSFLFKASAWRSYFVRLDLYRSNDSFVKYHFRTLIKLIIIYWKSGILCVFTITICIIQLQTYFECIFWKTNNYFFTKATIKTFKKNCCCIRLWFEDTNQFSRTTTYLLERRRRSILYTEYIWVTSNII